MQAFKQYSTHLFVSILLVLTTFITGCNDDKVLPTQKSIAPVVLSIAPLMSDNNVTLNTNITAFFDKELNPSTVNATTFTLKTGTKAVAGSVSYANNTMIFNPKKNLRPSTEYNVTISTEVKDLAGNSLTDAHVWNFKTEAATDVAAPTVLSIDPSASETGVPINRSVSALISETLDPSSVNANTFTLASSGVSIEGVVSYESNMIIFNPTADLNESTTHNATITTGVKDLAGNALATAKSWSFTTGTTKVTAITPVNLGTAGSFAILSKTGVSTTGTTEIVGDIGVSPAALTYITGFSQTLAGTYATSDLVTGKIYAANMEVPTPTKMTTAVSDMELAYTDAAGRTLPDFTELGNGNVSGMTLSPGLYKWGTGLLIDNRGVTISGGATDVWIFQIAGDLTVDNAAKVNLQGGALAKNIFWQVGGDTGATLGTTAEFKGVVLAQKGIVVNNGAIVNGSLLAQTAVTLDANAVTQP